LFSPDGTKIIWRASRPKTEAEVSEYQSLLKENLVAPTHMEVWMANADGSDAKQITNLEQANWAPNFTPDGKKAIFCSNHEYKRGFPFNMYLVDFDGNNIEKISRDQGFDAFPMFSPDGKKIVFTNGCFDILHRGHVEYLCHARDLGNKLILGLNTDASVKRLGKSPERPINSESTRAIILAALECIDAIVLFDEDTPLELITFVQPDILVKGNEIYESYRLVFAGASLACIFVYFMFAFFYFL
jgi:rfaE bifunctional protein nucleotidyltransferase chain/domain